MIALMSRVLILVGTLNWGVFGLFGIDLVSASLPVFSHAASMAHPVIGLAGVSIMILTIVTSRRSTRCPADDPIGRRATQPWHA